MTGRTATPVYVDAATVYAEGMLAGLRAACNIVGRHDAGDIPPQLSRLVTEWRAHVYHNQWLAERGRPADLPPVPDRAHVLARIHAFLATFPDVANVD